MHLLCCAAATKPGLLKSVLFTNSSLYQGVRPRSMCRSRPLPVWGRLARRRLFQRYESAFSSRSQTFPHPRSFASPPIVFALSALLSSGEHTHTHKLHNRKWQLAISQMADLHMQHCITCRGSCQWKQQGSITCKAMSHRRQPRHRNQFTIPEGHQAAPPTLTHLLLQINNNSKAKQLLWYHVSKRNKAIKFNKNPNWQRARNFFWCTDSSYTQ